MPPKQAGRQAAGRKTQQLRQLSSSGVFAVMLRHADCCVLCRNMTDLVLIRLKSNPCWAYSRLIARIMLCRNGEQDLRPRGYAVWLVGSLGSMETAGSQSPPANHTLESTPHEAAP